MNKKTSLNHQHSDFETTSEWEHLANTLDEVCINEARKNCTFISYLKRSVPHYQGRLQAENTNFKPTINRYYTTLNKTADAAAFIIEKLENGEIKSLYPGIDEEWVAKLKTLKQYAELVAPRYKPKKGRKGAKLTYSTYALANTFSYLWKHFYPYYGINKSHPVAEAFFASAGYRPRDVRSDGISSNIGQILRKADSLLEQLPQYQRYLVEPFIVFAQKVNT